MNNTHVIKEQHKEDIKPAWWDGALQGLAQRSGSAGNYNHNHIQCTSLAYYYTLSSPRQHHSQQVSLRLLSQTVPLYVCAEKLAERNFERKLKTRDLMMPSRGFVINKWVKTLLFF